MFACIRRWLWLGELKTAMTNTHTCTPILEVNTIPCWQKLAFERSRSRGWEDLPCLPLPDFCTMDVITVGHCTDASIPWCSCSCCCDSAMHARSVFNGMGKRWLLFEMTRSLLPFAQEFYARSRLQVQMDILEKDMSLWLHLLGAAAV